MLNKGASRAGTVRTANLDSAPQFRIRFWALGGARIVGISEQGGDNRGQMVEHFLRSVHLQPGQPGCAAFVHHVGYSAHYDHLAGRSSWPLPATGSCEALARVARAQGALREEPHVGDIFLLYSQPRRRFIHTGIVVGVQDEHRAHERDVHVCVTVEGNANDDGSADGHTTLRKVRTMREVDRHRFVRWVEMGRGVVAA